MEENKQQIDIEISEEQSEGIYANGVGMRFTTSEFIVDFLRFLPGAKKAKVFSRIIITPQTAYMLKDMITQNIKKYEENFGKIKTFSKTPKEIGFK